MALASCALTQSYTLDCRDSLGGITEVYFIEAANVTSVTESSAGGTITAITKASGKVFRKYELVPGTSSLTENVNANLQNGTVFYAQELSIILNKLQANTRNEILLLAKNNLKVVVGDNNGKYWYLGRVNSMTLSGGNGTTGTANGDRSGYTLTFAGSEKELAPEVSSSIIAGLTA
jgi:hypothetical protein